MGHMLHEPLAPAARALGLVVPISDQASTLSLDLRPLRVRQAVIMAGGKGTRLLPYSATLPMPVSKGRAGSQFRRPPRAIAP